MVKIEKYMKRTILTAITLLLAITLQAQSTQQDMDDKYATELVKAGTVAPDFKMKTPDGKTIQLSKYARKTATGSTRHAGVRICLWPISFRTGPGLAAKGR